MASKRKTAVALSEISKEIARRLSVNASEGLITEILRKYGAVAAELLESGESVPLKEVGTLKPVTIKSRAYPNPRGGAGSVKPDRRGVRLELGLNLKRLFGRAQ